MKKLFNLENLIYLTIFSLPLYLVKIKIWLFPTNVLEILFGLVIVSWIFLFLNKKTLGNILFSYKKYWLFIFLIFLGLVISAMSNQNSLHSLAVVESWFLIPLIFSIIAVSVVKKRENIFWAYFYSSVAAALIALVYLIFGHVTFDGRLEAFFNSPNYLAMYLAPALLVSLALGKSVNSKVKNPGMLIVVIAFYFTFSYAAWISIALSMFIIFLIKRDISFKKIALITAIFGLLVFSQVRNNKFRDLIDLSPRSSLTSRIMIWKSAVKIIKDNYFIGIGAVNFQKTYLAYQKYYPLYLEWAAPHPHNIFLAFWLYGGFFSFVGFLGLVFFWLKEIVTKIKRTPDRKLLVALGIMLLILIHGLFDTTYFKNDLAVIFWLNFWIIKD